MSKEAMKLALEALEWCHGGEPCGTAEAITALREALAEQPAPPPECQTEAEKTAYVFGWFKALESVREQEPVSFLDWYDNAHWGNEDFKDGCRRAWDAALAQRTWVGLTDEELEEILAEHIDDPYAVAYTVDYKLKGKNT